MDQPERASRDSISLSKDLTFRLARSSSASTEAWRVVVVVMVEDEPANELIGCEGSSSLSFLLRPWPAPTWWRRFSAPRCMASARSSFVRRVASCSLTSSLEGVMGGSGKSSASCELDDWFGLLRVVRLLNEAALAVG